MKDIYVDDDLLNLIVKSPDLFDIVATDYAFFYAYASLDRIFMRNVNRNLEHSIKNAHVSDSDFDSSGNYTGSGGFLPEAVASTVEEALKAVEVHFSMLTCF